MPAPRSTQLPPTRPPCPLAPDPQLPPPYPDATLAVWASRHAHELKVLRGLLAARPVWPPAALVEAAVAAGADALASGGGKLVVEELMPRLCYKFRNGEGRAGDEQQLGPRLWHRGCLAVQRRSGGGESGAASCCARCGSHCRCPRRAQAPGATRGRCAASTRGPCRRLASGNASNTRCPHSGACAHDCWPPSLLLVLPSVTHAPSSLSKRRCLALPVPACCHSSSLSAACRFARIAEQRKAAAAAKEAAGVGSGAAAASAAAAARAQQEGAEALLSTASSYLQLLRFQALPTTQHLSLQLAGLEDSAVQALLADPASHAQASKCRRARVG